MGEPTTADVPRPLVDSFGRVHTDLRISVTDRCNFRCTYCMPEEGLAWLPRSEVLTFEEVERIARVLVERHGIRSIRLTGGEPTVRAHLPVLVRSLAALPVDLEALHEDPGDVAHLLEREHLTAGQPLHPLLRHAVGAAEVAAIGHGDAQIAMDAPERVDQGHRHVGHASRRPGSVA